MPKGPRNQAVRPPKAGKGGGDGGMTVVPPEERPSSTQYLNSSEWQPNVMGTYRQ
jgi:hypothetical protein